VGPPKEHEAGSQLAETVTALLRLDAEELLPSDVVVLAAGDRAPADAPGVRRHTLEVQQSSLTGEGQAVATSPSGRVEPRRPAGPGDRGLHEHRRHARPR
jgi:magnesium-transporting ATPase (P-type)